VSVLYLHIPHSEDLPEAPRQFVTALTGAIGRRVPPAHAADPVSAVYIGGGPLSLSAPQQHRLARALAHAGVPGDAVEVTVEAAPRDVSAGSLHRLRRLGVTRLSLDVGSFSDATLRAIDAPHRRSDIDQALHALRTAGLRSCTVALHFGAVATAQTELAASLQAAVGEAVPHITLIEQPGPASADARADALEYGHQYLTNQGYDPYLLTDYAQPGHRSRYQTAYYTYANVLGLGPGAESFWWQPRPPVGPAWRWTNVEEVEKYICSWEDGAPPIHQREVLARADRAREYILLRLRTLAGLNLAHLATQYGVDLRARAALLLDRLSDRGRVEQAGAHLRLTSRGRLLADAITQRLLAAL